MPKCVFSQFNRFGNLKIHHDIPFFCIRYNLKVCQTAILELLAQLLSDYEIKLYNSNAISTQESS